MTPHRLGASGIQGQMLQAHSNSGSASSLSAAEKLFNQQNPSMHLSQTLHKQDLQQQLMTINAEPISPATSSLDFMCLPDQTEKQVGSELVYKDADYTGPELFNSLGQEGQIISTEESDNSLYIMGGDLGLSSYINDLLSNGYM
jgi:hypothetical protein